MVQHSSNRLSDWKFYSRQILGIAGHTENADSEHGPAGYRSITVLGVIRHKPLNRFVSANAVHRS